MAGSTELHVDKSLAVRPAAPRNCPSPIVAPAAYSDTVAGARVVLVTSIRRLLTDPGERWSTMYNCARGSLPASAGASSSRTPMPPGSAIAELDAPAGAGADICSTATRARVARIRHPSRLTSRMVVRTTYRTEWVIVAVYTPAAMPPGTAMLMVGFQAAELSPVIPVAVTAGLAPVRLPGLFAV